MDSTIFVNLECFVVIVFHIYKYFSKSDSGIFVIWLSHQNFVFIRPVHFWLMKHSPSNRETGETRALSSMTMKAQIFSDRRILKAATTVPLIIRGFFFPKFQTQKMNMLNCWMLMSLKLMYVYCAGLLFVYMRFRGLNLNFASYTKTKKSDRFVLFLW